MLAVRLEGVRRFPDEARIDEEGALRRDGDLVHRYVNGGVEEVETVGVGGSEAEAGRPACPVPLAA